MQRRDNAHVILVHENKFLVQHRDGNARVNPNKWGFFGGGMDPGESPKQAALRECEEELNYRPENITFLTSFQYVDKKHGDFGTQHFFTAPFPGFEKLIQKEGDHMELMSLDKAFPIFMKEAGTNLPALEALQKVLRK